METNRVYYWQIDLALKRLIDEIRDRAVREDLPFGVIRRFDEYEKLGQRYQAQNETKDMFGG